MVQYFGGGSIRQICGSEISKQLSMQSRRKSFSPRPSTATAFIGSCTLTLTPGVGVVGRFCPLHCGPLHAGLGECSQGICSCIRAYAAAAWLLGCPITT